MGRYAISFFVTPHVAPALNCHPHESGGPKTLSKSLTIFANTNKIKGLKIVPQWDPLQSAPDPARNRRSRSAFVTTNTDDSAIAAEARTGDRSIPFSG